RFNLYRQNYCGCEFSKNSPQIRELKAKKIYNSKKTT
ncbi:MAG: recombinase, partial [Chlamydiae bacterium]